MKGLGFVVTEKKIFLWKSCKPRDVAIFGPGVIIWKKLGRGPLGDATCQISNVWALRFQRIRLLHKLLTLDGWTHIRRRTNQYHKSSLWHFVPVELKICPIERKHNIAWSKYGPGYGGTIRMVDDGLIAIWSRNGQWIPFRSEKIYICSQKR